MFMVHLVTFFFFFKITVNFVACVPVQLTFLFFINFYYTSVIHILGSIRCVYNAFSLCMMDEHNSVNPYTVLADNQNIVR